MLVVLLVLFTGASAWTRISTSDSDCRVMGCAQEIDFSQDALQVVAYSHFPS